MPIADDIDLRFGDSRELIKEIADNSIDAIVCDPPYMIGFMGRAFDRPKDNIATDAAFWRECLRVLKPGAFMLCFGGTRTAHRMVCAIEDAGFYIENSLRTPCWFFGQGFNKSGRQLKPAWEPLCMASKPTEKGTRFAANAQKWGTGGLNIDACRISSTPRTTHKEGNRQGSTACCAGQWGLSKGHAYEGASGRWPSNVIVSPSDVEQIDTQSGILKSGKPSGCRNVNSGYHNARQGFPVTGYGDSGGASRFFHAADFESGELDYLEALDAPAPLYYVAKASQKERHAGCEQLEGGKNTHPTVKPLAILHHITQLVTPPASPDHVPVVLDPFMGSGSEGIVCARLGIRYIGMEREPSYFEIARARIAYAQATQGTRHEAKAKREPKAKAIRAEHIPTPKSQEMFEL